VVVVDFGKMVNCYSVLQMWAESAELVLVLVSIFLTY
jgi:hypothetical protein